MKETSYNTDFTQWATEQAALLKAGQTAGLDFENLADEIECLSKKDKRALKSHLVILMLHLLKLQHQPDYDGKKSWVRSVNNARHCIKQLLEDSPSLVQLVPGFIADEYEGAAENAEFEMGVFNLPETCPFTVDELLDPGFFPYPLGHK